jgi:hypothetical protein
MPSAPASGNLLLGFSSGGAEVGASGATFTSIQNSDNSAETQLSYRVAAASEPTSQTWAYSGYSGTQGWASTCFELSGIASSSQINASAKNSSLLTQGVTPTAAGAVFCSWAFQASTTDVGTASCTSGWTLLGPYYNTPSSYFLTMYIAYRLDAVAGTSYSCTLTISGTGGTPSTTIVAIAQGVASSAPFTRKAMFRQVTAGGRKGLTNAA